MYNFSCTGQLCHSSCTTSPLYYSSFTGLLYNTLFTGGLYLYLGLGSIGIPPTGFLPWDSSHGIPPMGFLPPGFLSHRIPPTRDSSRILCGWNPMEGIPFVRNPVGRNPMGGILWEEFHDYHVQTELTPLYKVFGHLCTLSL